MFEDRIVRATTTSRTVGRLVNGTMVYEVRPRIECDTLYVALLLRPAPRPEQASLFAGKTA